MAAPNFSYPAENVAEKVLRRVEIAKVTRNLQDRLALANFKAQNGWQNRALRTLEPEVTEQLRKKRPYSSGDVLSDCSSYSSEEYPPQDYPSPLKTSAFPRDLPGSNQSLRTRLTRPPIQPFKRQKGLRSASNGPPGMLNARAGPWGQTRRLPESSPIYKRSKIAFPDPESAIIPRPRRVRPSVFASRTSSSDNSIDQIPSHSFNHKSSPPSLVPSSPPRTPSPTRQSRKNHSQKAGADLLLFLANSPSRSPGVGGKGTPSRPPISKARVEPPSTPPSQKASSDQNLALPSSFLSTPNTGTSATIPLFSTPGQNFNFADFVNVTPSPAQAPWGGRTPGLGLNKTPGVSTRAGAARRGLNFDALVPPSSSNSPHLTRGELAKTGKGLALELGGKLIPRS